MASLDEPDESGGRKTGLGIPVVMASNSRNENGQMTFGMNDASGVFSTWPGTLGLAAANW